MLRNQVSKGTNFGEYKYLPENIREWNHSTSPIVRNPVSPIQMLSSGMLMARANAAGHGVKLSRRQQKRIGHSMKDFNEAMLSMNAPLGHGSVMT